MFLSPPAVPAYHAQTDTPSPLNHKRLRMEAIARRHTLTGQDDASPLSSCLGMPVDPHGDVSMDLEDPALPFGRGTFPPPPDLSPQPKFDSEPLAAENWCEDMLSSMARSLAKLNADSHTVWMKQAEIEQKDKETANIYRRVVESYEKWWVSYQAGLRASDPSYTMIPAFPVTAAKAVMFLDYETSRPKVWDHIHCIVWMLTFSLPLQRKRGSIETIPNSTVGKQVISQKINALENWRVNHHHFYTDNTEAQISLRFDNPIQRIESAAKHNEPKRTASSQALKAAGTSSGESDFGDYHSCNINGAWSIDTYTEAELEAASLWCMSNCKGAKQT